MESPPEFEDRTRETFLKNDSFALGIENVLLASQKRDFSGPGARLREGKEFKAPLSPDVITGLY